MLPFMKPKRVAGLIMSTRKPDGGKVEVANEGDGEMHPLEPCAEDILRAIASKDPKHLAMAIQAAFDIVASMPAEEGPQDESYDAQNIKAAKASRE